jgi:hypothetical protein
MIRCTPDGEDGMIVAPHRSTDGERWKTAVMIRFRRHN